ncbi:MAG: hypothetical protein LUC50_09490 [Ruminococcus sp.]|nr:hypothetical protein [Ruminococcus sp.]
MSYGDGFLEIDDDFLDLVGSNYTALYQQDGTLLYGENPIAAQTASLSFQDNTIQSVSVDGEKFYVYDRMLEQEGLENLWLRGTVSAASGTRQITAILRISLTLLSILVFAAIVGGYWFVGRILRPIRKISDAASQIEQGNDLKNASNWETETMNFISWQMQSTP